MKIGITSLLLVIFLVLKLTGTIQWSWVWVLSPLWIPLLIAIVAIAILFFIKSRK